MNFYDYKDQYMGNRSQRNQSGNNFQKRNNNGSFNNHGDQNNPDPVKDIINNIEKAKKLSEYLTPQQINLPEKAAFVVGDKLKGDLKTSQLRKFFDQIKRVETLKLGDTQNLEKAKNELYAILPQIAYSAGRKNCPKAFFDLLRACISPTKLQDWNDIQSLIDFIEAIVAYAKFTDNKKEL